MAKRYLVNLELTNYFADEVFVEPLPNNLKIKKNFFAILRHVFDNRKSFDGILLFNPSFFWFLAAFLLKLATLFRFRVVIFDLLLQRPETIKDKAVALVKRILLAPVDLFLFLHRDVSGYTEYYGIDPGRCRYIPFKANNYEVLKDFEITDAGYALSCGASHRDYRLLGKALTLVDVPMKIVLPQKVLSDYHNSVIDEDAFGENVEIIRHDFDRTSWYEYLSKCRCVVLPIRSSAIQCAGISVYLEAMAFGKPVIISEGPSTRDILTSSEAAIFPPGDSKALASMIDRVWKDEAYRQSLGHAGQTYALALEGEERLVKDILRALINL